MIEAAFRHGWTPIGAGEPRVLTERDYTEVRAILGRGGWTGLDQATIDAVRGGAQPGDPLPPLQALPYIDRVTDTEVILTGTGPGQRVTVCSPTQTFQVHVSAIDSHWTPSEKTTNRSGSKKKSKPAP